MSPHPSLDAFLAGATKSLQIHVKSNATFKIYNLYLDTRTLNGAYA